MKKGFFVLAVLIGLTGCNSGFGANGGSALPALTPTPTPNLNCSTAAGSWSGLINGNPDTLAITSECNVTSTYCASQTTYTLSTL